VAMGPLRRLDPVMVGIEGGAWIAVLVGAIEEPGWGDDKSS
jgi:hypothetical protein